MPRSPRVPVAGRRVEQHLLQAVVCRRCAMSRGVVRIGKQVLHRREAIGRRGGEAVEEVVLGVHHRQVGGKTRHGVSPRAPKAWRKFVDLRGRSAAAGRAALISHSRAVSSSSSSVAIAAAGESCQTFGPSRSSITARSGGRAACACAIACATRVGHRRVARAAVGDQRHVADLHHEVRRDRRQDVLRAATRPAASAPRGACVGVDHAARLRFGGVDARGAAPASCWRGRRRSCSPGGVHVRQPRRAPESPGRHRWA